MQKTTQNKLLIGLSWLVITTALGLLLLAGYWLFYPYKTTEFKSSVLRVESQTVKAGEDLVYYVDYCKYTDVLPEISKTFVDGIIYVAPPSISSTKKGCGTNKIQVAVPKNLPAGVYHLNLTYRYKMNPVREIDINIETEKFTVIK